MSRYRAVILDLDGTLIDTAPGIIQCAKEVLRDMQVPIPPDEEFTKFIGPPLPECFRLVTGLGPEFCLEAAERYKASFGAEHIEYFVLYPGMREMLEKCRDTGILLAVATFKQPVHMYSSLEFFGIEGLFATAQGADPASKLTKSQIIDRAIDAMHIDDRKSVLMVGDSYYDYEGACGSGIDFAAALYGYGFSPKDDVPGQFAASDVYALTDYIFSE